jgi:phage gp36-like protein
MATYTDPTTVETDWFPPGQVVEPRFLDSAAIAAQNVIDSKLAKVYAVPFADPPPGIIKTISDILTRLIAEYIMDKGRLPQIPKDTLLDPMKMLEDLVMGKIEIPGVAMLAGTSAWSGPTTEFKPIFERDSEVWHQIDDDLATHLEDWRLA